MVCIERGHGGLRDGTYGCSVLWEAVQMALSPMVGLDFGGLGGLGVRICC